MREYNAIFQDKRGKENIIVKSDGSQLYTTIRGIAFYGGDFDQLSTEVIDNTKFDYEMFADGTGDLTNFNLKITIPIQLYNTLTNQTHTENLVANIVVGEATTIDGLDYELDGLTLNTTFGEFVVEKKLEWMEDALIALQDQLSPNFYIKTCLSCKYSNYHPVGNGMFGAMCCFKNYKEEVETFKDKYTLMEAWTEERIKDKSLFFVQETFDCQEHELVSDADWVYKNWTKTIEKHNEVAFVENSLFYKELNILLRQHLQTIKESITPEYQAILKQNNLETPLPIQCLFEYASSWYGGRQWRFELDFDDYEWCELTFEPHFLNAFVAIAISNKPTISFNYQLCSSFNEALQPMEPEKISIDQLNEPGFVTHKIQEVQGFLDALPTRFMEEVKQIEFDKLEFIEKKEEIHKIINLHKVNDTKAFHERTQLFFFEAIMLMEMYINDYEKNIVEQARKMYAHEIPFCLETLKKNRIDLAQKRYSENNISNNRINIFNAINGFLTPFEEYTKNDEIERSYELEYKIDFLLQAGLQYKLLLPLVKKYFKI